MDHVAHRELDDLVALRPRDVGHLDHARRDVARCRIGADVRADPLDQRFVQHHPVLELHEQHDAHVADLSGWPILADDEALDDLRQLLDLAVDFSGADPHATGIERRVRAPVDHQAVMLGQLDIVAVAPDARKALEIGSLVFRTAGIVPEPDRHRRKRRCADELPTPTRASGDRLALVVVDVDRETEAAALELAAPHGQRRIAKREARHDVGAAGDRREAKIVLDALVDVVEAFLGERAPRREHRPQLGELEVLARHDAQLLRRVDVLRRRAEVGHPLLFGEYPERAPAVDERLAVEQQQRRARREA